MEEEEIKLPTRFSFNHKTIKYIIITMSIVGNLEDANNILKKELSDFNNWEFLSMVEP